MTRVLALWLLVLLTGCGTFGGSAPQLVSKAIPVKCRAEVPVRPVMPTDNLSPTIPPKEFLDRFVQAATAEIELRDGYEARLVAALNSCLLKDPS